METTTIRLDPVLKQVAKEHMSKFRVKGGLSALIETVLGNHIKKFGGVDWRTVQPKQELGKNAYDDFEKLVAIELKSFSLFKANKKSIAICKSAFKDGLSVEATIKCILNS